MFVMMVLIASCTTAHTILYKYFVLLLFIVNTHSKLNVINRSFIGRQRLLFFFLICLSDKIMMIQM